MQCRGERPTQLKGKCGLDHLRIHGIMLKGLGIRSDFVWDRVDGQVALVSLHTELQWNVVETSAWASTTGRWVIFKMRSTETTPVAESSHNHLADWLVGRDQGPRRKLMATRLSV